MVYKTYVDFLYSSSIRDAGNGRLDEPYTFSAVSFFVWVTC